MLKDEFLRMMRQDLVTSEDKMLKAMLECFEEVLSTVGSNFEIDSTKTVQACYKSMYDYASKHREGVGYVFTPSEVKKFIMDYLGVKEDSSSNIIKLEDFV